MDTKTYPNRKSRFIGWSPFGGELDQQQAPYNKRQEFGSWQEFYGEFGDLDPELNLVLDFYFLTKESLCQACDGTGYNKATEQIYYKVMEQHDLTEEEFDLLKTENRTLGQESLNEYLANRLSPDVGACRVLAEYRARQQGIFGRCERCGGEAVIKGDPETIELNLWMAHPRYGSTRGIHIRGVTEADLAHVREYLQKSLIVHRNHFNWVQS